MTETLLWVGFHCMIFCFLAIDLGFARAKGREIRFREALAWSGIWFLAALAFSGVIFVFLGRKPAFEFLTGYIVEWSLSIDNLFVFLTLFTSFSVPLSQQRVILLWGILGALVMRAILFFLGFALLARFHWMIYVFGVFLTVTGIRLGAGKFQSSSPSKKEQKEDSWVVQFLRSRIQKSSPRASFILILVAIELTDLIFAVDSIPAILAVTKDPLIVYTSNVFAILGLRSLYIVISGMMFRFRYLQYGLALTLIFIGVKICISEIYQIPIGVSLAVVGTLIGSTIALSFANSEGSPLSQKDLSKRT